MFCYLQQLVSVNFNLKTPERLIDEIQTVLNQLKQINQQVF